MDFHPIPTSDMDRKKKRYAVTHSMPPLPMPIGIENIKNSTVPPHSPMDITPKITISRDEIIRSPLKRTRLETDWGNSPMNTGSPTKRRALERSNTFPSPGVRSPVADLPPRRTVRGNIKKSFGLKEASATVKNLFKTDRKKCSASTGENPQVILKASMLAMLLVHKQNFAILKSLSSSVELNYLDAYVEELFDFFTGHNRVKRLIDLFVTKEIQETASHTTLFRETSCATKLIGLVFKREVTPYFEKTKFFETHVKDIAANCDSYELDPSRVKEGYNVDNNRTILLQKCSDILVHINSIVPKISPKISHVMKILHHEVGKKWTEGHGRIAVNSFLFLRYICPSFVSPSSITLSSGQRRALILVSKVLQSVSNLTMFEKEPYMETLNCELSGLNKLMDNLFQTLQEVETPEAKRIKKLPAYYLASDALQQRLVIHEHSIIPTLSEETLSEFEEAISVFSAGKAVKLLSTVTKEVLHRGDDTFKSPRRKLAVSML